MCRHTRLLTRDSLSMVPDPYLPVQCAFDSSVSTAASQLTELHARMWACAFVSGYSVQEAELHALPTSTARTVATVWNPRTRTYLAVLSLCQSQLFTNITCGWS